MRLIGREDQNTESKDSIIFASILLGGSLIALGLSTDKTLKSMCVDINGSFIAEVSLYITSSLMLIYYLNKRMSVDMSITTDNKSNTIVSIMLAVLLLVGLNYIILSFVKNKQEYLDIGINLSVIAFIVYIIFKMYTWSKSEKIII